MPWWTSCHRATGLRGFVNFSRGYFDGQKFFLVAISWVPNFFSRVFRWSETFFRGSFVGPNLFSWVPSWVQDYLILTILLISIMFNLNSFYRIKVLKLHYLCFFYEKNCKKNRKTYFVSQGLNEIKCKITSKTTRNFKSKSIS